MSHAVWCPVCPRPAVCRECGTDYGDSTEAANACCRD